MYSAFRSLCMPIYIGGGGNGSESWVASNDHSPSFGGSLDGAAAEEDVQRLAEDHANARTLAMGLAQTPGLEIDPERSLLLALFVYSVIAVWGFFLDSVIEYWCLAWLVACVQGGSQALTRSLFSTLVPAAKGDVDIVKAAWSEVELGKRHPRSIDDRDCELRRRRGEVFGQGLIAIGHTPNTAFLDGQLDMDENQYLITQPDRTATNVEGVFAAGSVRAGHGGQLVQAAAEGVTAAQVLAERHGR